MIPLIEVYMSKKLNLEGPTFLDVFINSIEENNLMLIPVILFGSFLTLFWPICLFIIAMANFIGDFHDLFIESESKTTKIRKKMISILRKY